MQTFLNQAAVKIFNNHKLNELQHLKVILPSRRAVLYFKNELASLSDIPFFAPEIVSIDDFIKSSSIYSQVDSLKLLFTAYEIWIESEPTQPVEKFLSWINIMLKDFDLIDMALMSESDQRALFKYMSAAEALNRWEIDLDEYEPTETAHSYFNFFDKMSKCYYRLNEKLKGEELGYTGTIYRDVAEHTTRWLEEDKIYYFVGLNALTRAEEKIANDLKRAGKARFIWDTDEFYMKSGHMAGSKLMSYQEMFGPEWDFKSNYLETDAKDFKAYRLGSNILEVKLAVDLLSKFQSKNVALIVLDDNLFSSLYLHLPGLNKSYNVSVGMSFRATILHGFLLDFLKFVHFKESRIALSSLKSFLINPFVDKLLENKESEKTALMKELVENPKLFYPKSELKEWFKNSKVLDDILEIKEIQGFLRVLETAVYKFIELIPDEKNFGYLFIEKLENLQLLISGKNYLTYDSLLLLIKEIIKSFNIPFESSPDSDIQVMSMLETRALDFEEIIFLSFKEGNLPSNKKVNSFLPFDALIEFKLPVYSDQDAMMSYHFYRLIQRAKQVHMIYSAGAGGVGVGEPSRFLYQIEENLMRINPKIQLNHYEFNSFENSTHRSFPAVEIEKTPEVLEKIKTFLIETGLSPTSINEYFESPITFYWKYVEKIAEKDDEDADLRPNDFGNIVHTVLERLDQPYLDSGAEIGEEDLKEQKKNAIHVLDNYLDEISKKFDFNFGINRVMKSVISKLLLKYYDSRINQFKAPFKIYQLEQGYYKTIEVNGISVKVKGRIDKIEQHGDVFHLIDYKTGMVKPSNTNLKDNHIAEKLNKKDSDKFRQLCIYVFLLEGELGKNAKLESRFYSFRNLDNDLKLLIDNYTNDQIAQELELLIEVIVSDLLDANKNLGLRPDEPLSEYSDFLNLLD